MKIKERQIGKVCYVVKVYRAIKLLLCFGRSTSAVRRIVGGSWFLVRKLDRRCNWRRDEVHAILCRIPARNSPTAVQHTHAHTTWE